MYPVLLANNVTVALLWCRLLTAKIFQKVRNLLNCVITQILVPGYSLEGGIEPKSESSEVVSHPDGRWRLTLTSGCGQTCTTSDFLCLLYFIFNDCMLLFCVGDVVLNGFSRWGCMDNG